MGFHTVAFMKTPLIQMHSTEVKIHKILTYVLSFVRIIEPRKKKCENTFGVTNIAESVKIP